MNCKTVYLATNMLIQVQGDIVNLFAEIKVKLFDRKCYSDKMKFSIILRTSGTCYHFWNPAAHYFAMSQNPVH